MELTKKGFTLPELLITAVIMALIVVGSFAIYLTSYTSWRRSTVAISLQRDANMAMEKMVRGERDAGGTKNNGIREAGSFTIPGTSVIRFRSGIDGKERSFYLSDGQLMYDPDVTSAGSEIIVASDLIDLKFEKISDRRVRISLTMERFLRGESQTQNIETEVTIRN